MVSPPTIPHAGACSSLRAATASKRARTVPSPTRRCRASSCETSACRLASRRRTSCRVFASAASGPARGCLARMNAIVLTFDRLPVSFLACYGNNWIETPNFDRLAAHSVCFHQHFAESLTLDTVRHAWWSGCYECRRQGEPRVRDLLPAILAAHGVTVRMLFEAGNTTDETARDLSQRFPDWTEIVTGADGLEVAPDDTPFLRLVARAQRDLRLLRTSRREPWLLWIKSRGVPLPWLPPAEYARLFLDVDDDEP